MINQQETSTIPITGTFLDEISHDIPSQNWGHEEWERDFQAMKAIGFEFSHFMSPNSCYLQAGNLFQRYREYFTK